MENIIEEYYKNNAQKLRKIVFKILRKFGGISEKDYDDFYSLANEVFAISIKSFDPNKCGFDGFLRSNLTKRIITEIRDRNRGKRSNTKVNRNEDGEITYKFLPDLSLDAPLITCNESEGNITIEDIIVDDFNMYEAIWGESKTIKYERYLAALPKRARKIADLLGNSHTPSEIKTLLHITDKQYSEAMYCIKASEYISLLY